MRGYFFLMQEESHDWFKEVTNFSEHCEKDRSRVLL